MGDLAELFDLVVRYVECLQMHLVLQSLDSTYLIGRKVELFQDYAVFEA